MKNIAIIPARGGSKRLPRKNILPFMGKPMFLWTYEAAVESGCFDVVLLSSEDEEILNVAQKHGVLTHKRPPELATDKARCVDVCRYILDEYECNKVSFDLICCLYATAPLRTSQDIKNTMALLAEESSVDFAVAACQFSHSPYQALIADKDSFLTPAFPLVRNMKSQQLPKAYIGNGSVYAARVEAFKKYHSFTGSNLRAHFMPQMYSVDIDTQEEYEIALCFAKHLSKEK